MNRKKNHFSSKCYRTARNLQSNQNQKGILDSEINSMLATANHNPFYESTSFKITYLLLNIELSTALFTILISAVSNYSLDPKT